VLIVAAGFGCIVNYFELVSYALVCGMAVSIYLTVMRVNLWQIVFFMLFGWQMYSVECIDVYRT